MLSHELLLLFCFVYDVVQYVVVVYFEVLKTRLSLTLQ